MPIQAHYVIRYRVRKALPATSQAVERPIRKFPALNEYYSVLLSSRNTDAG
jgi:hypothetical protein